MMSFYEKLQMLAEKDRDFTEDYMLHYYSLEVAEQLLDYLIRPEALLPNVFEKVLTCCRELNIPLLPEAAEYLKREGIDLGAPFLQALIERFGEVYGVGYKWDIKMGYSSMWSIDRARHWCQSVKSMLEKYPTVTSKKVIEELHLQRILRHFVSFDTLTYILKSCDFSHIDIPRYPNGPSRIVDHTVLQPHVYYVEWHIDVYRWTHKDPAIRLADDWESFFFSDAYVGRVFTTLANALRMRDEKSAPLEMCGRIWVDSSGAKGLQAQALQEEFFYAITLLSATETMSLARRNSLKQAGLEVRDGMLLIQS